MIGNPVKYYRDNCLRYMVTIERHNPGKLFHELYPELWEEWVKTFDSVTEKERERKCMFLYNKIAKIIDELGKD